MPMDILLAEDDRVAALKLSRSLEKLGHRVTTVADGAAAWRRILDGNVTLLISDWMMPAMDGPDLCRLVRGRVDALYTYIILLTSRDSREDRLTGMEAGADDFLTKPFDAAELIARLNVARRILAMQEELRAHAATLQTLQEQLERQNALLAELAVTDTLTGLKNRRHFFESLVTALSFAGRTAQPISLLLFDVDHFKAHNDAFGHPAGDEALKTVAALLRDYARAHEVVSRYGGEEFAILLPGADESAARQAAERLRQVVSDWTWPLRRVTISVGIATAVGRTVEAETLVREADQALYAAKRRGRNRCAHYCDSAGDGIDGPAKDELTPDRSAGYLAGRQM
jgi:two-component system, cell cycle response regulator